jgi:DNA-binding MarR family transcriptional regulator
VDDARVTRPARGDNVLLQTFRTLQPIRELMNRAVADTGITQDDYAVLGLIGAFGPITPSELSTRLGVPRTSMSRYVARFLEEALATRAPNPDDRRSYLLELTPRGREIVAVIAPRVRDTIAALREASQVPLAEITAALVELEFAAAAVAGQEPSSTGQ